MIQVCYDISLADTREREIRALKKGLKDLKLEKGIILTNHQEESIKDEEFEIRIMPIFKWLQEHPAP